MGRCSASLNAVRLESPIVEAEDLSEHLKITPEARRRSAQYELMHRAPTDERESKLTNELVIHRNTFRGPFALTGLSKAQIYDTAPPLRINEDVAAS
eukprot:13701402-Heterocapsa_arctica.AAC.1